MTRPLDQTMPTTDQLARLPRHEQQRILAGKSGAPSAPFGVDAPPRQAMPTQRTKGPAEMAQSAIRAQPVAAALMSPPQRTLTAEEKQARLAAFEAVQSRRDESHELVHPPGQPPRMANTRQIPGQLDQSQAAAVSAFEARFSRAATPPPARDVTSGQRTRQPQESSLLGRFQRTQVPAPAPHLVDRNRDGYPDYAPGPDGLRQDQIGYRDRLRLRQARIAAAAGFAPLEEENLPVVEEILPAEAAGPSEVPAPAEPEVPAPAEPEVPAAPVLPPIPVPAVVEVFPAPETSAASPLLDAPQPPAPSAHEAHEAHEDEAAGPAA